MNFKVIATSVLFVLLCLIPGSEAFNIHPHHLICPSNGLGHASSSMPKAPSAVLSSDRRNLRLYSINNQNENKQLARRDNYLVKLFLRGFWKGITLPFPALRRVVLHPSTLSVKKKTIGLSAREGILAVLVYLTVGVLAYHVVLEKWSIVDALYFTCTCFSTVGYGDLCPSTNASKTFTCIFGLGGIVFLGAAVATIGSSLVQAELEAVKSAKDRSTKRLLKVFYNMPRALSKFKVLSTEKREASLKKARSIQRVTIPSWAPLIKKLLLKSIPSLSIIVGGGFIMGKLNGGWSIFDSVYYSLVTASTIGFGDIAPQTKAARLFAIFFIPMSVAAAGELLSSVALTLVQRRQRQVYKEQLERTMTLEHLNMMDADGDGKITREEYVQFMLLEMGRVDKAELDELFKQFDTLDVSRSGYLDSVDLELMAKLQGFKVID